MAATTKYRIAEQIQRKLEGGNPGVAAKFHIDEIKLAVEQCLNRILKMEYLNVNIPMGEMIPNGASIATYENIPVVQYKTVSKATLPAYPIKLPRGMGVYEVFGTDYSCPFIPLEMGQWGLVKSQPLINDLLGQVGYSWLGNDLIFTTDLTLPTPIDITVRLVVLDISQYDDWTLLPVPSDMELQIIDEVFKLFANSPVADRTVDPGRNEQRGIPVNQQNQS